MLFCTFLADNSFHHPPANFNTFENVGNDDTMPSDAKDYFWPSAAAASSNLRPILVSSAEKGKIILSGDKLNSDVHNSTAHFCYNT